MVSCPVSGRVVLLVSGHNWCPLQLCSFLNTDHIFSSSLITLVILTTCSKLLSILVLLFSKINADVQFMNRKTTITDFVDR